MTGTSRCSGLILRHKTTSASSTGHVCGSKDLIIKLAQSFLQVEGIKFAFYTSMAHNSNMLFIETPIFTKLVEVQLTHESYIELQQRLLLRPQAGVVIPGSGGLRKLRWATEQRGKSGGFRIIYYWDAPVTTFYMLFLYPKNEQENLTSEQTKRLRKLVEEYLA